MAILYSFAVATVQIQPVRRRLFKVYLRSFRCFLKTIKMKTFRVASLQIESSNAPISQTGVQTLPSHALAIVGILRDHKNKAILLLKRVDPQRGLKNTRFAADKLFFLKQVVINNTHNRIC